MAAAIGSGPSASSPGGTAGGAGGAGAADTSLARRVKVYQLNDAGQWDDRGTGHVCYTHTDDTLVLTVRSEDNGDDLLEHRVEAGIDYQRQGDTIITWCEPNSGVDLALSFQE